MADIKAKVHLGADGYCISVAGVTGVEKSEQVSYGDVAELISQNGKRYLAYVDEDDEVEDSIGPVCTEYWVYEATPIVDENVLVVVETVTPVTPVTPTPLPPAQTEVQTETEKESNDNGNTENDRETE
jgi:hypothetical protein